MEATTSEIETSIQPFNSQSSQNELLLTKFQQIKEAIAQAKTVEDALQQKRIAGSYEQLAKQWRVDKDIQFDATELRIRSERRLGQLILERTKNQKTLRQASGKSKGEIKKISPKKDTIPTLIELGVSKSLASTSRSLAKIDDGQFEVALLKARTEARCGNRLALSTSRILKQVRIESKESQELRFSPIIKPSDNWNVGNVQYGHSPLQMAVQKVLCVSPEFVV